MRWTESVLANTALLVLGPVGLIGYFVDYFTGNMFEYIAPKSLNLGTKSQENLPQKIIIAPVAADTKLESDEAERMIYEKTRAKYPLAQIYLPQDLKESFERISWTYSSKPSSEWKIHQFLYDFQTQYIVYSKVSKGNKSAKASVTFNLKDEVRKISYPAEIIHYESKYHHFYRPVLWAKSQLIDLAPNAVSTSITNAHISGFGFADRSSSDNSNFDFSSYILNGGQTQQVDLSVSNLNLDMSPRFEFVFRFATNTTLQKRSVSIKKNRYQLEPFSGQISTQESSLSNIDRYIGGFGIGPEIGVRGALGYYYLNLLYGLDMTYNALSNSNYWDFYTTVGASTGYKLQLTRNLVFSFFVLIKSLPEEVMARTLEHATKEKGAKGAQIYETTSGISLIYAIPGMRSNGTKLFKNLFD